MGGGDSVCVCVDAGVRQVSVCDVVTECLIRMQLLLRRSSYDRSCWSANERTGTYNGNCLERRIVRIDCVIDSSTHRLARFLLLLARSAHRLICSYSLHLRFQLSAKGQFRCRQRHDSTMR